MRRPIWALLLVVGLYCTLAHAGDVSFTYNWNANTEPDIAGYRLYQSTVSGQYTQPPISIDGATSHTVTVPQTAEEQTIYGAVKAIDRSGNESASSNEVSKTIPAQPSQPASVEVFPVAVLTIKALSQTELEVGYPTLPEPYKLDIRLMPTPFRWGSATVLGCALGTCRASDLTADTLHGAGAIIYRGTLNQDAVFGPFTPVVEAKTFPAPIIPPVIPPVSGLRVLSDTPDQIVVSAPKADCRKLITSTAGSTATTLKRTIRCVK